MLTLIGPLLFFIVVLSDFKIVATIKRLVYHRAGCSVSWSSGLGVKLSEMETDL